MPHRALLLVDLQNDFCAGGALAVPEGDSTVEVANRRIDWCQSRGEAVIASQDWHPANHGSFASQHGVEPYTPGQLDGLPQTFWPDHCVQNSEGAQLHPLLNQKAIAAVFHKGENPLVSLWNMIKDMGSVFRIKSFALHLVIYLSSFTARDIVGATYVFYIVYAMQSNPTEASNILTFGSIIGIPCNLVWPKIMSKLGPSKLLRIMYAMMFFTVACYAGLYYGQAAATSWGIMTLYALQVTWGISNSGTGYVPWTVYTFIPDVDEMVTKQRREGIFAGIMTFARKTTSALAPFLTGIVLSAFGFNEGAKTQSAAAINGLIIWMLVGTTLMLLLAFVTSYFFKLDRENHKILRDEIDRLKAGGKMADVDPAVKAKVEDLTGFGYDQLWGHNNIV